MVPMVVLVVLVVVDLNHHVALVPQVKVTMEVTVHLVLIIVGR